MYPQGHYDEVLVHCSRGIGNDKLLFGRSTQTGFEAGAPVLAEGGHWHACLSVQGVQPGAVGEQDAPILPLHPVGQPPAGVVLHGILGAPFP